MDSQVNSLRHFQQHSRLHFIGQWKTRMEDTFKQLFAERPEWNHGKLYQQNLFIHIDMDAFFCNVQLAKPEHAHLRSLPVGIAAGKFNSDISSCNYLARGYGIHAGMYVNAAKEICPDLQILGYDLAACEAVALQLYRLIFSRFQNRANISVEVYSIDEVVIATDTADYELALDVCHQIRSDLRELSGCTASCGVAPNIMLARIATKSAKPDGVRVIRPEEIGPLLRRLPFSSIHGVGDSTLNKVTQLLISKHLLSRHSDTVYCADVQALTKEHLQESLGRKAGETFYKLCRGEDSRVVVRTGDLAEKTELGKGIPNSVGSSMNYAVRPTCVEDIWKIALQLVEDSCVKLDRYNLVAHGARVTLLERHPLHPKQPQKYMGRGKCIELHVSIKFAHPLSGSASREMLSEVQRVVVPLLVSNRDTTDEDRAKQLGLDTADDRTIWTITLSDVNEVLIPDIRGMTVQLTGLKEIGAVQQTEKQMRTEKGQMSLLAAFSAKRKKQEEETPSPLLSMEQTLESEIQGSVPLSSAQPIDTKNCLYVLSKGKWSAEVCAEWQKSCRSACEMGDYALVKAHLKCALYLIASSATTLNAKEEYDRVVQFVSTQLPVAINIV
ncbi:DNA damage repair protein [Strigomonas culicis]|uniref:DNA damage repair protein n=1 Tax=Strigomonas culicis TaxID=28005 RepID=S9VCF0_9TRYP|nr:DNA damage repair protein [Strigomonas culicis]|eukprot:EPY20750.1 DNA damage repair protein [Strigomonas culicis]